MILKDMFKKTSKRNYISLNRKEERPEVPLGLLRKCNKCKAAILTDEVVRENYICPKCGTYYRMPAYSRIRKLTDEDSFEEWDEGLVTGNPLEYKGYLQKVEELKKKTGLSEAVVTGCGTIEGQKTVIGVMDGRFLMASMGQVVGEKITRAIERATKESLPIILVCCSGGARMQEGILSLMQMAKISAALKHHSEAGNLYIPVLTDPTTGGVTASFAMLGDIILAEPGALIGFAGPRVIEQTIGEKLPEGFQSAEFLLEHGFIDAIVERNDLRDMLSKLIRLHEPVKEKAVQIEGNADVLPLHLIKPSHKILKKINIKCDSKTQETQFNYSKEQTPWEKVQRSRRSDRPVAEDYVNHLFEDFTLLHGDRLFADDPSVLGGIATFHDIPVTVIALSKGHNTNENVVRNFGMSSPEGYRKALRLMKQAEKFDRPIICLVDTPGAFCGLGAEERGQGEAIARNLYEMASIAVPIVSIVIGEGGSGGALALAVADEVWMLENAVYSILSPEGYASILWKDSSKAKEAAKVMRLTADDLMEMGVIEQIIKEPEEFTIAGLYVVCEHINRKLYHFVKQYQSCPVEKLKKHRYERFRQF